MRFAFGVIACLGIVLLWPVVAIGDTPSQAGCSQLDVDDPVSYPPPLTRECSSDIKNGPSGHIENQNSTTCTGPPKDAAASSPLEEYLSLVCAKAGSGMEFRPASDCPGMNPSVSFCAKATASGHGSTTLPFEGKLKVVPAEGFAGPGGCDIPAQGECAVVPTHPPATHDLDAISCHVTTSEAEVAFFIAFASAESCYYPGP